MTGPDQFIQIGPFAWLVQVIDRVILRQAQDGTRLARDEGSGFT
jgi:hypothetical protein